MSAAKNLIAGLGGAIALNLLHESLKHRPGTPRIDLLGEEALQKGLETVDAKINDAENLYKAALGADIISNTMYYATIGAGKDQNLWKRALTIGLTAGIGAVTLPEPMGLDENPVSGTLQKKAMTVGYYVAGALVTAGLLKLMARSDA